MTWIVGAPTIMGYGFAISDIRVTLGNGQEVDYLQKVYPVGKYLAAGFAGSVRIGFAMIDELRRLSNYTDESIACDPEAVASQWPACARAVFDRFPQADKAGGCDLMLICVHPLEHNGNPSWPKCFVMVFKSPDFKVEQVQSNELGSVGSGSGYKSCKEIIDRFSADYTFRDLVMTGEWGNQGGMASMIGINLTATLKEVQPQGVSSHLHYCWVYRGRTIIRTNDNSEKGRWTAFSTGSGVADPEARSLPEAEQKDGFAAFRMPGVVTSWDDLLRMFNNRGLDATGCIA